MSAAGYISGRSVSFYESQAGCEPWSRTRRTGEPAALSLDHVMASVAVPFLFPPVSLGDEYYGDGAMREANPFSAAIHLGAQRLLVVGTRNEASAADGAAADLRQRSARSSATCSTALFSDGLYGPGAADAAQSDRRRASARWRASARTTCSCGASTSW